MGWSSGQLILVVLVLVVAIVAATYRLGVAAAERRNARRARRFFVLGFVCGFMSSAVLRQRRRSLKVLEALTTRRAYGVGLLGGTRRLAAHIASLLPGVQ